MLFLLSFFTWALNVAAQENVVAENFETSADINISSIHCGYSPWFTDSVRNTWMQIGNIKGGDPIVGPTGSPDIYLRHTFARADACNLKALDAIARKGNESFGTVYGVKTIVHRRTLPGQMIEGSCLAFTQETLEFHFQEGAAVALVSVAEGNVESTDCQ